MASVPCSNDDGNMAVMMMTNLETGDVINPCGPCLPGFALTMAASLTAGMPPETAAEYAEQLTALSALLPASAKRTGKRRNTESTQETAENSSEHNGSTASQDESSKDSGTQSSSNTSNQDASGDTGQATDADLGAFDMAPGQ